MSNGKGKHNKTGVKKEKSIPEKEKERRENKENENKSKEEIIEENKKKHQSEKDKKGKGALTRTHQPSSFRDRMNKGTRTRYPKQ